MSSTSIHFPACGSPYSPHAFDSSEPQEADSIENTFACVVRTDADMATEYLRNNIIEHTRKAHKEVGKMVTRSYANWGKSVVDLIATHLDFSSQNPAQFSRIPNLQAHFFKAAKVSQHVVDYALSMVGEKAQANGNYMLLTLDDMIRPCGENVLDLAFSRKFDKSGVSELGYVARPGYPNIEDQIARIKAEVDARKERNDGKRVPLVFLEDNIRRARMMNWVIEKLDDAGVFESAYLEGISTCFCSASREELKKISFEGKPVRVVAVAHYDNGSSDVITPRDLFFDGYVVEVDGHTGRLPAIFMDVSARFKIQPGLQETFKSSVALANIIFCMDMKTKLGVDIPLKWMENGETISRVTGKNPDTLVVDVMRDFLLPSDHVKQPVITPDRKMMLV